MRLKIGLILALLLIALVGLFLHRRNASQQSLRMAQQSIRQIPGYNSDADYFEKLARGASGDAMSSAYSPPSGTRSGSTRATAGSTDHNRYLERLIRSMIKQAETDGKSNAARVLREYYKSQFGVDPAS